MNRRHTTKVVIIAVRTCVARYEFVPAEPDGRYNRSLAGDELFPTRTYICPLLVGLVRYIRPLQLPSDSEIIIPTRRSGRNLLVDE
jgi:hypothetical protein